MKHPAIWATLAASAALALGAATANADNMSDMSAMKSMHDEAAEPGALLGNHAMPGKVTKVDHKSGMVYVTSMGMHMAVHFPPPTIEHLKAGDKILLHLGYSFGG